MRSGDLQGRLVVSALALSPACFPSSSSHRPTCFGGTRQRKTPAGNTICSKEDPLERRWGGKKRGEGGKGARDKKNELRRLAEGRKKGNELETDPDQAEELGRM